MVKREHAKLYFESLPRFIFIDKGKGKNFYEKISFMHKGDLLKEVGEIGAAKRNKDQIIIKFELKT